MAAAIEKSKRTAGWMGIHRGHRARPLEWIAEKFIFLVSLSAIVMVFLIFAFVLREALPVFFGTTNSSLVAKVIPAADMDKLKPEELRKYLDLDEAKFKSMDRETLK